jgi:two-component system NtrC family response regulator/two-component system response regulator HydG
MEHAWPGNVRELEHAIERAVILARTPELDLSVFPFLPKSHESISRAEGLIVPGASLEEIERDAILKTLEASGGSTSRAARVLKISPRTIQYKLKQYRSEST